MAVKDYRELIVWQKAVALAAEVYRVTEGFPDQERFSLTSPMRRSAVSIGSNIAEGCGRETRDDYLRFLRMAYASACELETHAHVASAAGIGRPGDMTEIIELTEEVRRVLSGLKRSITQRAS